MVLSRNDKRKRKEGDLVDLVDPLSGANKRPKVHAQRKFAQGAATPFTPSNTSVKEKEKPKPPVYNDLIANKCPNTEDFLTFLCFRGTSILPPTLNYFNLGSKKDKNEKSSGASCNNVKNVSSSSQTPSEKSTASKSTPQKSSAKVKSTNAVKKSNTIKMSNAVVNKKAGKFNVPMLKVQALKKKLQGQRLVNQTIKSKLNSPNIIRTRSRADQKVVMKQMQKLAPRKLPPKTEIKRFGLRSSGLLHHDKLLKGLSNKPKYRATMNKPTKKVIVKPKVSDSSESNSEDESCTKSQSRKNEKKVVKKIGLRRKIESKRITRSYREDLSSNLSRRPTRKTKEAAAVYMEILGRKLVSPEPENEEDNISVDSFPELPNAKKITQTENEFKAKVKLNTRNAAKEAKSSLRVTRLNRNLRETKSVIVKNKRQLKLKKYCEIESDEDSECSEESSPASKPVTRNSTRDDKVKVAEKPKMDHNLRSAVKKTPVDKREEAKVKKETASAKSKDGKEENKKSVQPKRKKIDKSQENLRKNKAESNEGDASEEETLGELLSRMNKRRQSNEGKDSNEDAKERKETKNAKDVKDMKEAKKEVQTTKDKDTLEKHVEEKVTKEKEKNEAEEESKTKEKEVIVAKQLETIEYKISDDEESFKGFSKKSISKALSILSPEDGDLIMDVDRDQTLEEEKSDNEQQTKGTDIEEKKPLVSEFEKLPEVATVDKCGHDKKICMSNIIDMPPSAAAWKEKLNMSNERIEKWLSESSLAKEVNKIEMETESGFKFEEVEEKKPIQRTHLSISNKIQHLVRPVNVTLSKLADKSSRNLKIIKPVNIDTKSAFARQNLINMKDNASAFKVESKVEAAPIAIPKVVPVVENVVEKKTVEVEAKIEMIDTKMEKSITEKDESLTPEKKSSVQPRKLFQKKIKERNIATPSANAFSPENESSVYAFESDNEMMPVGTPFRRKTKDGVKGSSGETTPVKQHEKCIQLDQTKTEEDKNSKKEASESVTSVGQTKTLNKTSSQNFELPKNLINMTNMQVLQLDKLTTNWSNINCSSSIAVQVNLDEPTENNADPSTDEERQKSNEISTQTDANNDNDNDDDGANLFYIPIQAVTRNGANLVSGQQVIQAVAVKFDTDGQPGANQRVLLKAKLVTKPPITVARCPPIGTVQPTTRTPPNPTESNATPLPSSSLSTTNVEASTSASSKVANESVNKVVPSQPEKVVKSPKVSREKKATETTKGKRASMKSKAKFTEVFSSNKTSFPSKKSKEEARLVEAPTFHPTEKDFQDPLEYIDKIRSIAEKFGICRVVPPPNFKPECKVSDDMRFTAYNQYVHKMLHRWGPNVKEMMAIKKYLATQSITLTQPPWIGGMEVDLPHLYQTVQSLGGLKEVIEKKKWQKVADGMKIPRSAQDRVTKLDDIYCKYLLPYDTLSPEEREKLFDEVESEWKKKESRALQRHENQSNDNEDDEEDDGSDDIEECIVKGRNMPLNAFYRIARNTQRMWFGENQRSTNEVEGASAEEVEVAFWKHVAEKKRHVCVHNASIDSSGRGFGFSVAKNSPFARHPWNLKVLTNNAGSVLRALGPLMGVTVPTLHVGMLFSACCWYRDPHGLPWIEYLHTGAKKIWYGIPDEHNNSFRDALMKMVPRYCKNKTIWLPSDTAMVPPEMLVRNGVSLCHTVQEPGEFIIVFPKAFTSSICTGYVVSESVYFAQSSWLDTAEQVFKDIKDSCEPSIFSLEKLLISIINDTRSQLTILNQILPTVKSLWEKEISLRNELTDIGLTNKEKLSQPESGKRGKGKKVKEEDGDFECETCRANLSLSLVSNSQDESVYCLSHALQLLKQKKSAVKNCTLMYTYDNDELLELIDKLQDRINAKSKKTNQIKK